MGRIENITKEVKSLHDASNEEYIREWFFEGHVNVVAEYGRQVAVDAGADPELVVLAALFHDIARTWGVDEDPGLMNASLDKAESIMNRNGYSKKQIDAVREAIMSHSCKGKMPRTPEGKTLATADALAHLMTHFYLVLPFNGWLKAADNFEDYRKWVLEKIERDFRKKIFFEKYRKMAEKRYEAMKVVFQK